MVRAPFILPTNDPTALLYISIARHTLIHSSLFWRLFFAAGNKRRKKRPGTVNVGLKLVTFGVRTHANLEVYRQDAMRVTQVAQTLE